MVNTVRYARVFGGAVALLVGLSGCAGSAEPCAGVGVVTQVGVFFAQDGYDGLAGASVRLCAHGRCVEDRIPAEDVTSVNLPLPDDIGPDLGTVRFRVTRKGSTKPFIDASTDKRLSHQSDGCGGGAYNGALAFTKEGGLTATVPKSVSDAWIKQVRTAASRRA
ncbi:hypothetical protein ACIPSJ_04370 [Streptomyces sp. NPDC090088]|uniref:hypothetical protein n=1 Tax=Streptomyces sp. NPDC090088 TaxID=3365944 RepID=UPI00381E93F8